MASTRRPRRDLSLTPTSKEELKAIAAVSAADIARADLAWRDVAEPKFRDVLDAVVE